MEITRTVTYDLNDIPTDLVDASVRRGVAVIVQGQWDQDCYMLRLISCVDDVEWPEETGSDQIEQEPDYKILSDSDYDGGYNWGWLVEDERTARELPHCYADYQRRLYPNLKIVADEAGIL